MIRDRDHFDQLQDWRAEDSLDGEPVTLDQAVRVFLALSSPAVPAEPVEHQTPSAALDDNRVSSLPALGATVPPKE